MVKLSVKERCNYNAPPIGDALNGPFTISFRLSEKKIENIVEEQEEKAVIIK